MKKNNMNRAILLLAPLAVAAAEPKSPVSGAAFYSSPQFIVYPDRIERGGKIVRLLDDGSGGLVTDGGFRLNCARSIPEHPKEWRPADPRLKGLIHFKSEFPMLDSLHELALNRSLEILDYTPPQWPTADTRGLMNSAMGRVTWVRDTAHCVMMGGAYLFPEQSRKSIERNIDKGVIHLEQAYAAAFSPAVTGTDTPCYHLSDSVIGLRGIWKYGLVSGDAGFLRDSVSGLQQSLTERRDLFLDRGDWLYDGGASIADGHTAYPWKTMGNVPVKGADTCILHYDALKTMADMLAVTGGEPARREEYLRQAYRLKDAIMRELWLPERNWLIHVRTGDKTADMERFSAMAQALAISRNLVPPETAKQMVAAAPEKEFGIPLLWPFEYQRIAYHDQMMWHLTEAYWSVAAAKAGSPERLVKGLALMELFGGFQLDWGEQISYPDGLHAGMLCNFWSCLAIPMMLYDGLAGLEPLPQGLLVQPNVPEAFRGGFELSQVRYGKAVLTLRVKGSGQFISRFLLDGKPAINMVPADLEGAHLVEVEMSKESPAAQFGVPFEVGFVPGGTMDVSIPEQAQVGWRVLWINGATGEVQSKDGKGSAARIPLELEKGAMPSSMRVAVQVLDSGKGLKGMSRWQYVHVRPAMEATALPGEIVSKRTIPSGQEYQTAIVIRNNTPVQKQVSLKVESPAGLQVAIPAPVQIAPLSTRSITIPVQTIASLGYGEHRVVLSDPANGLNADFILNVAESLDLRGWWYVLPEEEAPANASAEEISYQAKSWGYVQLPAHFKTIKVEKIPADYAGFIWVRKHQMIPYAWRGHSAQMELGKLSKDAQVYFNGTQLRPAAPGVYSLPQERLKFGENNTIAIRVERKGNEPFNSWPIELKVLPVKK
jgi:hypothetical protein